MTDETYVNQRNAETEEDIRKRVVVIRNRNRSEYLYRDVKSN
jgi:hypothetical protein